VFWQETVVLGETAIEIQEEQRPMAALEDVLISVWRQVIIDQSLRLNWRRYLPCKKHRAPCGRRAPAERKRYEPVALYYLYRLFLEGGCNAVKQWGLFE
jgi:hypothetical protein